MNKIIKIKQQNHYIHRKCINAKGMRFHPEHFRCSHCQKGLVNQSYRVKDQKVYCKECALILFE